LDCLLFIRKKVERKTASGEKKKEGFFQGWAWGGLLPRPYTSRKKKRGRSSGGGDKLRKRRSGILFSKKKKGRRTRIHSRFCPEKESPQGKGKKRRVPEGKPHLQAGGGDATLQIAEEKKKGEKKKKYEEGWFDPLPEKKGRRHQEKRPENRKKRKLGGGSNHSFRKRAAPLKEKGDHPLRGGLFTSKGGETKGKFPFDLSVGKRKGRVEPVVRGGCRFRGGKDGVDGGGRRWTVLRCDRKAPNTSCGERRLERRFELTKGGGEPHRGKKKRTSPLAPVRGKRGGLQMNWILIEKRGRRGTLGKEKGSSFPRASRRLPSSKRGEKKRDSD